MTSYYTNLTNMEKESTYTKDSKEELNNTTLKCKFWGWQFRVLPSEDKIKAANLRSHREHIRTEKRQKKNPKNLESCNGKLMVTLVPNL